MAPGTGDLLVAGPPGGQTLAPQHLRWTRIVVVFFSTYVVLPVLGFLDTTPGTVRLVAGLAAVLAFAALFVRVVWVGLARPGSNRTPRSLAAMTVLAVPLVLLLGRPGLDLSLLWLLGCYIVSTRRRWWLVVLGTTLACEALVLLVGMGLTLREIGVSLLQTTGYAVVMIGFYQLVHLLLELGAARSALARYAVTEERLRFARDLHDLLGQRLSAAALRAELAGRLAASEPDRSSREAHAAAGLAREALADVREAVSGYRQMSLADELDTARPLLAAAGVRLHERLPGQSLGPPLDELVAWVVREGVTNIVRHADARSCWVTVRDGGRVTIEVADDGRGAQRGWGNGLTGLAERLRQVGGTVTTSEQGERFTLRAELPERGAP